MSIEPTSLIKKKLENHFKTVSEESMNIINIISEIGINEMHARGLTIDKPEEFNPAVVATFAAEKFGIEQNWLVDKYLCLLELEEMIVR